MATIDVVDRSRSTIIKRERERERASFLSLFVNTVAFSLSLQVGEHSLTRTSSGDAVLSGDRERLPLNGFFLKEAVNKKPKHLGGEE